MERETGRVDLDTLNPSWLIFSDGFSSGRVLSSVAKRVFDIAVSGLLLALAFPVIALFALLVKLDSRGPAFFRQQRVGLYGQPFTLLKLRSMRTDAEAGGARWAEKNDPRITRLGRFIRKVRIDELPQVWTVLKGEMSFVGPRPEVPTFVDDLEDKLPYYAERHMLRVARKMVQIDPRQPRAYFLQAVLAARAGLNDLARRLLEKTNGAYDDAPAGQLLAGILELRSDNAALAVDEFDDLARRQPENASAALLLGRALLADGDANEVVARFRAMADRQDASPYLLALVGRAYEQMGQRAEAARYLDRAQGGSQAGLAVLPADEVIVQGAGAAVQQVRTLLAQGQGEQARAMAAQLREQYPDSIDVESLAGDVALMTGDAGQALLLYRRVAEVRRDFALVQRMVAAEQRLGRDGEATALLTDYLRQNPRSFEAAAMLGRMTRSSALLAYADRLRGRPISAAATETALARR